MSKENNTPKKKGGCLKPILIAIGVFLVIGIVGSMGSGDSDKKADNKPNTSQGEQKKDEPKKEEVKEEHFEIDLGAGHYTAGKDIPVGTYNLLATGGNGNVMSSNMFNGGINEIMGKPADEYTQETFNGLKLKKNDVLTLNGNVTLHLTSENALVSKMEARKATESTAIDLNAGNYTAGKDFPAGVYNVVATGNSGNVISSNSADGGINEVMGATNDGHTIQKFTNVSLPKNSTLEISGTSIQLVPVGE